jgi:hypothetical protein
LLKESTIEAVQKVIELTGSLQELVVADELLNAAEEVQREEATCSEAAASGMTKGNTESHNTSNNVIEIESSSTSISASTSTSLDNIDDIPLNRVYENLQKSLAPSPSTKHQKKPIVDEFVPMYPSIQPPFIQPLQTIPADAEVERDQAVHKFDIPASTSSPQPQPTTQSSNLSVLEELTNHYS